MAHQEHKGTIGAIRDTKKSIKWARGINARSKLYSWSEVGFVDFHMNYVNTEPEMK